MKQSAPIVRYVGYLFSVAGARVIGILITSATFPFLVRRLGVEMYGVWSYVIAVCAFLEVVANPGLTTYATQQFAAKRTEAAEILPNILTLRLICSVIAGGALWVLAAFDTRSDVCFLLRFYGIGMLGLGITGVDYLLNSLELFHARAILTIAQQSLYAAGIFVFIRGPADVNWVPVSILGSAFVANLAGWLVLRNKLHRLPTRVRPAHWKAIIVPSVHYGISTLMSNLYHRTGHVLVRWLLGEHALGLYAAALRLVGVLRDFVTMVLVIMMPRMALAARMEAGMVRLSRMASSVIALLSIPLMFGTVVAAHLIVPLVMGANYSEAIPLVKLTAPYLVTAPAASLLTGTILYAMGRHRAYLASTMGGAIAGVLLYSTLIPLLGLKGAGIAFVIGELVVAALGYVLLPADLRGLWKNPLIAVAICAALLMTAAVVVFSKYNSQPILVVTVGAAVYLLGTVWFVRKWLIEQLGGL
jgi:O-antigen/teichoic acid export membrane protein